MRNSVALYAHKADPSRAKPFYHVPPKVADALVARGDAIMIRANAAQLIREPSEDACVDLGAKVRRIWFACIVGKHRAVSGGLMSPGIATTGPRNIAKIPHEMSPYFQGR